MMKTLQEYVKLALLIFLLSNCSREHNSHESNIDRIKKYQATINYELDSRELMGSTELLQVNPTLAEVDQFYIKKRTIEIESFPCSNCHSVKLNELKEAKVGANQKAHWGIKIEHASDMTMQCSTCHSETDLNQLNSITGSSISMDESYKSCAQCHSTQFKEWQGGAHGKREGGWVPPRIVKTCVECHNPHKPAFETRWPSRLNTSKLTDN